MGVVPMLSILLMLQLAMSITVVLQEVHKQLNITSVPLSCHFQIVLSMMLKFQWTKALLMKLLTVLPSWVVVLPVHVVFFNVTTLVAIAMVANHVLLVFFQQVRMLVVPLKVQHFTTMKLKMSQQLPLMVKLVLVKILSAPAVVSVTVPPVSVDVSKDTLVTHAVSKPSWSKSPTREEKKEGTRLFSKKNSQQLSFFFFGLSNFE